MSTTNVPAVKNEQPQLPAYLAEVPRDDLGTDLIGQYIVPPRLKIVQPLSRPPLIDMFAPGTTAIVPTMLQVSPMVFDPKSNRPTDKGEPFRVVPIFFYPEFILWNPLELRDSLPAVRERTTNPQSALALRCKSLNREDVCPENPQFKIKYVEHLNFVLMILDGDFFGTPLVASFSRAEHKTGSSWCSLIKLRRAHLCGCVFQFQVSKRTNAKGQWYGFDITNPAPPQSPWLREEDAEVFAMLKQQHEEMKEAYAAGLLQTVYDEEESNTVEGTVAPEGSQTGEY